MLYINIVIMEISDISKIKILMKWDYFAFHILENYKVYKII